MALGRTNTSTAAPLPSRAATARLREQIFVVASGEELVALFAAALAEHGVRGHFCVTGRSAALVPILGDAPDLIGDEQSAILVECGETDLRVLLRRPDRALTPAELTQVRGYAELYAARAIALRDLSGDVETGCGLSLRQRYVLGRRLAGLAPLDIAAETGLTVATVSTALDDAVERLGALNLVSAIDLAARRGWLAVTSLESLWPSPENSTYKVTQNG